jgi:hypothetical protein
MEGLTGVAVNPWGDSVMISDSSSLAALTTLNRSLVSQDEIIPIVKNNMIAVFSIFIISTPLVNRPTINISNNKGKKKFFYVFFEFFLAGEMMFFNEVFRCNHTLFTPAALGA